VNLFRLPLNPRLSPLRRLSLALLLTSALPLVPAHAGLSLPPPSSAPQKISAETDPFLKALAERAGTETFNASVMSGVAQLPALGEQAEAVNAAKQVKDQAQSRLYPELGLNLIVARTLVRDLNNPATPVENLAPLNRNDALGSIDQLITDFGATSARIRQSSAGIAAAKADLDAARNQALLALISTWYDVLEYRSAVTLAGDNVKRLQDLAEGAALRFQGGIDSGGDVARARAYVAGAQSQQVNFERQLAAAEARYLELFGAPAPQVARVIAPEVIPPTNQGDRPEVLAAKAQAREAAAAVSAAKADRLPVLSGRLGANGYNLIQDGTPAYDVRGQIVLSTNFATGGAQASRVSELKARRRSAELAVERIELAAARELSVAEADVAQLRLAIPPLEAAYLDSRRARDLYVEQFRVSRGTLFDVLRAERDLLDAALALSRSTYDLDVARFNLLAKQNGLIERFGLSPAAMPDAGRESK
jgi:adhesin transport system outer membrane protein